MLEVADARICFLFRLFFACRCADVPACGQSIDVSHVNRVTALALWACRLRLRDGAPTPAALDVLRASNRQFA